MRPTRHLLLHLFAAVALVLAACGDDDGGDTTAADDAEESGEQAAEDAIGAAGGGECGFLAEFAGGMDDLDPTGAMGSGESIDFGQLYGQLADEFQEVADAAPDDIEDSFQVMADAVSNAAEQLEGVEIDFSDPQNIDPEAFADLEVLEETFDEDFQAAADEVGAWLEEHCGDLGAEFDFDEFGGPGIGG